MLGRGAVARPAACPRLTCRLARPFNTGASLQSTITRHHKLTAASLKTYDRLHGDLLVPRGFVVPSDPEWQPDCHGHRLGHHLHQVRKTLPATRGLAGASDDVAYIVRVAEEKGSVHQWDDVVRPKLQRYFDERQGAASCPDWAHDLFEFGLGWLLAAYDIRLPPTTDAGCEIVCDTDAEVVALRKVLQDIVFRGHFVSGYPERVDWLRERGLDSAHMIDSRDHGAIALPGSWRGQCPWGWCDGDESLHHMLCLESKLEWGSSSLHTQPYYTKQQKDQMRRELEQAFRRLKPGQDGQIDRSQVPQLVRSVAAIAKEHDAYYWDEHAFVDGLDEYTYDVNTHTSSREYTYDDAWDVFAWVTEIDHDGPNPWGEAAGPYMYRDEQGRIISSPLWEAQKEHRTSAEGIASLRFSRHDTPGYERWVPMQTDAVDTMSLAADDSLSLIQGRWCRGEWVPL